jgi:opacity protein-like surface antigen
MRKLLAFAASTAISLGAWSVASANGTVHAPEDCPKPVHHKKHHHKPVHHHQAKPAHCPPPCAPCPSLHSGFFAGLKGGYGWAKGKVKHNGQHTIAGTGALTHGHSSNLGADGGLIGLFLGYDRYFPNCWMLGIEGAAQWTDISGKTSSFTDIPAQGLSTSWRSRFKTDWSYDVALRLGRKVYDCSLWYVKAGAQFTHFKLKASRTVNNTTVEGSKSKYRTGFLAGLGVEVPVACHWSLGAEYNFTYYQRISASRTTTNGTGDFVNGRIRPYSNTVLARVIWKQ